ncbi:hypothetical protein [Gordonia humi]|uniref:Putative HicB family RNase H-like nuclease n=1 Tax=Gordonia humi TaxID=686429 RepID=A0A840F2L6_9ACTN|nr:hypothetical protein [Gordonia humi]MBB4138152.1 putative HicB family RNase H-like nuclease [Gordonia humi]
MADPRVKTHTAHMSFRVPEAVKSAARQGAADAGMSLTDWITLLIAQGADQVDLIPNRLKKQEELDFQLTA